MEAARKVRSVPALADELRASGRDIILAGAKADPRWLVVEVGRYLLAFGVSDREQAEHAAATRLWLETLAPLPREAIEHGMREVAKVARFTPKVGEVYQAALPKARELQMMAYRAKRALEDIGKAPVPKEKRMSREEMIAAGFMGEDGKIILAPPRPIPSGRTAVPSQHELAERLRQHAARQEQRR